MQIPFYFMIIQTEGEDQKASRPFLKVPINDNHSTISSCASLLSPLRNCFFKPVAGKQDIALHYRQTNQAKDNCGYYKRIMSGKPVC